MADDNGKTQREASPNSSNNDESVKCTRCRNTHAVGDRIYKRKDRQYLIYDLVCPRCGGRSYTNQPVPQTK